MAAFHAPSSASHLADHSVPPSERAAPDRAAAPKTPLHHAVRRVHLPGTLTALPPVLRPVHDYVSYVDGLGDEPRHARDLDLGSLARDIKELYGGRPLPVSVVRGLAQTVEQHHVPAELLLDLVDAQRPGGSAARYDSFGDLLEHCRRSVNPVGRLVLQVVDRATPDRLELSDRICVGLHLLEHWRCVRADAVRGRICLPREDLSRFGVTEAEVVGACGSAQLPALLAFETSRALAWLNSGAVLTTTLHGWGRFVFAGYLARGRADAELLRRGGYAPTAGAAEPTARDLARAWLTGLATRPG